ncbi:MAG: type IV toxin-antitoxin system AbiEi family antitoxin domain-containing protein [Actinobacteria bacterium]|nr:type IV toxin-antitoxin system AbiEi family antitoxin domain-containing protein [Actinomycetota bacterium]
MDALLAQIATTHHGLVTRAQLIAAGFTDTMIMTRISRGWLEVVHPGVYRVAGSPHTWEQRLLAAVLSVGDATASHRSAAALWKLDGPFRDHVEVTTHLRSGACPDGAVVHRSTDLTPGYVTERAAIPVTDPVRTLVDLGAVVTQRVLDRALDHALARRLATYDDLLVMLDEVGRRGRRGVGPLRKSLAGRSDAAESVLEAEFQRLIRRFGLPEPVYQFELYDEQGRFVGRIDAAYPDLRMAIELDGAETRVGRQALDYDTDRQNRIIDCGFLIRRYTWSAIVGTPVKTAADLDRTIARRRNELWLPAAS